MKYNVYELHPRFRKGYVYKGKTEPKIVMTLDTGDLNYYEYMEKNWYEGLCWSDEVQNNLKLDELYYVVAEDLSDFCVLSLHKGHAFWDTAEHDNRVVIAVELGLTKEQAYIL